MLILLYRVRTCQASRGLNISRSQYDLKVSNQLHSLEGFIGLKRYRTLAALQIKMRCGTGRAKLSFMVIVIRPDGRRELVRDARLSKSVIGYIIPPLKQDFSVNGTESELRNETQICENNVIIHGFWLVKNKSPWYAKLFRRIWHRTCLPLRHE